jgi:hypothetical protein
VSTINDRLDALASVVKNAFPAATVYAPDKAPTMTDSYPIVEVFPRTEHTERTATGQWGNALHEQVGSHGPDKYYVVLLQTPLTQRIVEQDAKRALNDLIDTLRNALTAKPELPDDNGDPTVLDAATYIATHFGEQGEFLKYHGGDYIGAVLIVDIVKQYAPAGG